MPIKGLPRLKASAWAAFNPMSSAPGKPGPWVAATASRSAAVNPGVAQGLAGDGQEVAQMLAGGEFGNDAAVFGVQRVWLAMTLDRTAAGNDRRAGFIARSLESEQVQSSGGRAVRAPVS
jgi:hypothetical protein